MAQVLTVDALESACVFCDLLPERLVAANAHAVAIRDGYPVTPGHTLVLPRRHVPSVFDLADTELAAVGALVREVRTAVATGDPTALGFNVGVNDGPAAGQTVMHAHVHVIPRRAGDMADPRGGVRHVIPERGNYLGRHQVAEGA